MSDVNEIIKLWSKVLSSRSKTSQEHNDWLSIFLSKYILGSRNNQDLPAELVKHQVNICNVLSHCLLSDIHNVCSMDNSASSSLENITQDKKEEEKDESHQDENTEAQLVGKYLLTGRGWKVLWALQSTSLQGLSYHGELAELLLSLLTMVLQMPVDTGQESNHWLFAENSYISVEDCFHVLCQTAIMSERKPHKPPTKKTTHTALNSSHGKTNSSDSGSCIDHARGNSRLRPFLSVSFIRSSHHFDYFSQPCLQSEVEEIQKEEEETVQVIMTKCQEETSSVDTLTFTSPRITDLILRLLQKIFLKRPKWKHSEKQALLPHQLGLCKTLSGLIFRNEGYHPVGWTDDQLEALALQLLRLILLLTSSLTEKGQNNYLKEDLVRELLKQAQCSHSKGKVMFSYECLFSCLCVLQSSLGFESTNYLFFIRLVKLFATNGGPDILVNIVMSLENLNGCQKEIKCVLSRLASLLYRLRGSKKGNCVKKKESFGSFDISIHHHKEQFGQNNVDFLQDGFCCILTLNRIFLSIFSTSTAADTLTSVLCCLNRVGICCCTGFRPLFHSFLNVVPNIGPELQTKLLVFLEKTLLKQAAEMQNGSDLCPLCSSQNLLTSPSSDLSAWCHMNLYCNLLLSCDWPLARVVCRHLMSLSRTHMDTIKEAIFNRIVLPVFVHCMDQQEVREEKQLCLLEFSLLTMFHLLEEMPLLVQEFLTHDLLSHLALLLSCPRLRFLTLNLLAVLLSSSQQLVDDQPECHPGALLVFDKTLATCDVQYFKKCVESLKDSADTDGEIWNEPLQNLLFSSSVWHSCHQLSSLPAFRKHLVSGKGLGATYHLLEETLKTLTLPCMGEARRTIVVLLESLLSLCLLLVPFYVIQDSKYITSETLLETVQENLLHCDPVNVVWLRQVYDSLLNCSIDVSSTLRAPAVSWAFQRVEEEDHEANEEWASTQDGLPDESSSSCFADLESEAAQDKEGDKLTNKHQVIVRPQVIGLVLRLLWHHLRDTSSSPSPHFTRGNSGGEEDSHGSRHALEGANYVLQRLAALCKQDTANKAILYEQDILQYIYNFLDISFGYESSNALVHEFQIVLVDLWVCVSAHSISRAELFTFLRFVKDRPQAMSLLLNGLTELLKQATRQPYHSLVVTGPRLHLPTTPTTPGQTAGEGQDLMSLDGMSSESQSGGGYLPLMLHKTHLSTGLDSEGPVTPSNSWNGSSPWALATLALPLSQDPNWNPRLKGFSVMLWTRLQSQSVKDDTSTKVQSKIHLVSLASNFWLLEIWCQSLDGSLIIRVSYSSNTKHTILAEVTLQSVLTHNCWQHLTFTYKEKSTRKDTFGEISLTIDGSQPHAALLKYCTDGVGKMKCLSSCVLLGHSTDDSQSLPYICQIGTFMLFKGVVLDLSCSFVLSSLGPNLENLTEGAVEEGSFQPYPVTPRLLRTGLEVLRLSSTAPDLIRQMQMNLFVVFNARNPTSFLLYPYVVTGSASLMPATTGSYRVSAEDERCSQHHPRASPVLVFGKVSLRQVSSLHLALEQLGGPDILLFLFARVVGETDKEEIQSWTLNLLLEFLCRFPCCSRTFLQAQGPALLHKVLENAACKTGLILLKTLLNCAVSRPVMRVDPVSGHSNLDSQMESLVLQPWMLALCVSSWRAWDTTCLSSLFRCLEFLVREKHSFASFNLGHLHQIGLVPQILGMLKEMFQDGPEQGALLNKRVCASICRLLCHLVGCDSDLLASIWDTIILFHPQDHSHMAHTHLYLEAPTHSEHKNNSTHSGSPELMSWEEADTVVDFPEPWGSTSPTPELEENLDQDEDDEEEDSLDLRSSDSSMSSSINMKLNEAVASQRRNTSSTEDGSQPSRSDIARALELSLERKSRLHDEDFHGDDDDDDSEVEEDPKVYIVTGLLELVKDVLLTVPDSAVCQLIPNVVKPSAILFLVNHPNSRHRATVVQVFSALVQRCSAQIMAGFVQMHGFQLFTNQLHQFPANSRLFASIVNMLSRHENEFERVCNDPYNKELCCEQDLSTLLLLGLLYPSARDTTLAHNILTQILQATWNDKNVIGYFFKNGVVQELCRFLLEVSHQDLRPTDVVGVYEQDLLVEDVHQVISRITEHFLLNWDDSGSSQNLEDLLTHLCMNFIHSYQHCGSSSRCVCIFRDCVCMVFTVSLNLTNKLLDYALSERFRGTVVAELLASLPGLLHPFVGLGQDRALPIVFAPKEGKAKDTKASRTATSQLIHRFSHLITKACNFLIFQSSIVSLNVWSAAWEELAMNLLNVLGKKLQICLALNSKSYSSFRFSGLHSLKDAVASQLSKFFLWQLVPEQPLSRRRSIIAFLSSLTDSQNILTAILQHTAPAAFLQMLSFLHALLNGKKDGSPQDQNHVHKIINTMLKCRGTPTIDIDDQAINEALSSWHRSVELERQHWQSQLQISWDICQASQQALREDISRTALQVTREVVEKQNKERKALIQMLKVTYGQRLASQRAWKEALATMTHERALWHDPNSYPVSWQLDPTEGPLRVRRKLQRCFLNINSKFVLPEARAKLEAEQWPGPLSYLFEEQDFVSGRDGLIQRLHTDEQIRFYCNCTVVLPAHEIDGEILIGDRCVHFVGDKEVYERTDLEIISHMWHLCDIREILHRRFQLRDNALELFLTNGQTYLLAFASPKVRDSFFRHLSECPLPALISMEQLNSLTDRWRQAEISNFEYLTHLNKLAGRSFNDLMQYPVFPFILADYTSERLDLTVESSFRNLSKPMAIQDKKKEQHYTDLYKYLKTEHESCSSLTSDMLLPTAGAYHYGSHYSNSGTLLHFLVRLPPFTRMMLVYQDRNFDLPDRTFHSIHTSWRLASGDSATDFKELIPEFFYLPEFLVNSEGLDLGVRQTGQPVRDVLLPPWCGGDARLFILIHRQTLECPLVTGKLHRWIDLVFGFQQTGKAAVDAINVFHPATYYGLDISPVQDPLKLGALQTMIRTFGQMPKQLFTASHPPASSSARVPSQNSLVNMNNNSNNNNDPQVRPVLPQVVGLRWGTFVGSPSCGKAVVVWQGHHPMPLGSLLPLVTGEVYGLTSSTCLLISYSKEKAGFLNTTYVTSAALVSWGHPDGVVRIKVRRDTIPQPLLRTQASDPVSVCAAVPDCSVLFVGRVSGLIRAHKLTLDIGQGHVYQNSNSVVLHGHSKEVSCISVSKSFSLVVSGGMDGNLIVWDLNRLSYVRTLVSHESGVVKMCCISETLGDIAAIANLASGCCLTVHTVNGWSVGRIQMPHQVTALGYSTVTEGLAVNVLATGFSDGSVRLWSSWNLECVSELKLDGFSLPIVCLTFSTDNQHLFLCNTQGRLVVWQKPSKQQTKIPSFLTVL